MKSNLPVRFVSPVIFFICLIILAGCDRFNPFDQYDELHRPQYHFSPPVNWMGAPASLVYFSGEYHLFYLQNRAERTPETRRWGHAVSKDLVSWEHLSAAMWEEDSEHLVLPGSVVVDWENTAGFSSDSEPAMVAIYTTQGREDSEFRSEFRTAYSTDRGRTWTHNETNITLDEHENRLQDPKVFWHDSSSRWVMALAASEEQKIQFYSSENLKDWQSGGEFESEESGGSAWSRPDMFELPVDGGRSNTRWVLAINVENENSSASGARYFIGEFDGEKFTEEMEDQAYTIDYGADFYGAISFSNISRSDNRRIWLGWMNNWNYAENLPTAPWLGAMTIPREVSLATIDDQMKLVQQPVVELRELRSRRHRFRDRNLSEDSNFLREAGITGSSQALIAVFEPGNTQYVGFELRGGEGQRTIVGYDSENEELFVDRSESGEQGFDPEFATRHSAPLRIQNGQVTMRIFLDRSSIEVFGNEGEAVITDLIFPSQNSDRMSLYVRGGKGRLVSLDIWKLESIW